MPVRLIPTIKIGRVILSVLIAECDCHSRARPGAISKQPSQAEGYNGFPIIANPGFRQLKRSNQVVKPFKHIGRINVIKQDIIGPGKMLPTLRQLNHIQTTGRRR